MLKDCLFAVIEIEFLCVCEFYFLTLLFENINRANYSIGWKIKGHESVLQSCRVISFMLGY